MSDEHDCTKIGGYSCGDCVKNLRYALRDSNDEYEKLKESLKAEMRSKQAAFDQRDASDLQNDERLRLIHNVLTAYCQKACKHYPMADPRKTEHTKFCDEVNDYILRDPLKLKYDNYEEAQGRES